MSPRMPGRLSTESISFRSPRTASRRSTRKPGACSPRSRRRAAAVTRDSPGPKARSGFATAHAFLDSSLSPVRESPPRSADVVGKRLVRIVLGAAWAGLTLPVPSEHGPTPCLRGELRLRHAGGWRLHFRLANPYLADMLVVRADGFVDPCPPSLPSRPPGPAGCMKSNTAARRPHACVHFGSAPCST
jgi:hypothetical protein